MTLDDLVDFLSGNDIQHYTTSGSIVLSSCPECGSENNKVWLYKDRSDESKPFFGKCMKCSKNWNSFSYLIAIGIEPSLVKHLHGTMENGLSLGMISSLDIFAEKPKEVEQIESIAEIDVSLFASVDEMPNHSASLYAKKRGWTKRFSDSILIDQYSNAVVFVVKKQGKVIGIQRRFVAPRDPKMKTMSSPGFPKRSAVMEFPNEGDVCVCEGPFSALSANHLGYHGICTFGCNVGEEQLDIIANVAESNGKKVYVGFDLDEAGEKGFTRIANTFKWRDIPVFKVKPEYGNDLNDSVMAGKGMVVDDNQIDLSIPYITMPF